MSLKNIKNSQGFTIVELLIVVVVIAILAAITIVSYNGITNKANASAAASTASALQKKIELYQADVGSYPTAMSQLTTAATDKSYYIQPSSIKVVTTDPTTTNGKDSVKVVPCTGGLQITYATWATPATATINVGTQTACGTTPNAATWVANP